MISNNVVQKDTCSEIESLQSAKNHQTNVSCQQSDAVTLNSVKILLDDFRATRTKHSEPVPRHIWDKVRILLSTHSEGQILSYLSITRVQLNREKRNFSKDCISKPNPQSTAQKTQTSTEENITFCEVEGVKDTQAIQETQQPQATNEAIETKKEQKTTKEAVYPLDCKPAKAFATSTCIVELFRPDGMKMKIHICTDRFNELLHAFFMGNFSC